MKTQPPSEYSTIKKQGTPGKRIKSLSERRQDFYSYIDRNGPVPSHCPELGRCHVWTKSCLKSGGYGQFNINGGMWRAHVLAFLWAGNEIKEGQCVCHRCDNPKCCNPSHLFTGTHNANMQDMIAKGRAVHPKWDETGTAKLTKEQVSMIKDLWNTGKLTKAKIGRYFGVDRGHAGMIISGLVWKGVEPSGNTTEANRIADQINSLYTRKVSSSAYRPGESHPNSRITDAAVEYIRAHPENVKELAVLFSVTEGYVREILIGRRRAK